MGGGVGRGGGGGKGGGGGLKLQYVKQTLKLNNHRTPQVNNKGGKLRLE